ADVNRGSPGVDYGQSIHRFYHGLRVRAPVPGWLRKEHDSFQREAKLTKQYARTNRNQSIKRAAFQAHQSNDGHTARGLERHATLSGPWPQCDHFGFGDYKQAIPNGISKTLRSF